MRAFVIRILPLLFILAGSSLAQSRQVLALLPSQVVTPEVFWQHVDETINTLNGLKNQPKETTEAALDSLAEQWAQVNALALPEGASVENAPIDTGFLVARLRQRPYDLVSLINIFTNLRNARNIEPTRSFGAMELSALEDILQQPEFQWNRPPSPLEELWNDFLSRIQAWLNEVLGADRIEVPIPADVFTITSVILLVLILLYVFRSLFGDVISEASMDEEHMAGDELLTAETALQKAKDISKVGDYRTAVRYLYLSSLLTLDERGLLRFDRSKTNREYLRSVSTFPQLSAPLRDVIEVFDRVWYGFQVLDEDSFQHYVQKVDQLREQKK